jgi:hypothetical protein
MTASSLLVAVVAQDEFTMAEPGKTDAGGPRSVVLGRGASTCQPLRFLLVMAARRRDYIQAICQGLSWDGTGEI